EKSFCKPQCLGPGEEQFLSLLNLFLSLLVEFVHSIEKRATKSSRACSHVQSGASTPLQPQSVETPEIVATNLTEVHAQLQPWLVPHSVQTPQAPARITLSLPQTEQVMPMKMLPRATVTRSDEPTPFPLPFFASDFPPFPTLDG